MALTLAQITALGIPEDQAKQALALLTAEVKDSYVPLARLNEEIDKTKAATTQVRERDKQLAALKADADATEGLKTRIGELETANKEAATKHAAEVARIRKTAAVTAAIGDTAHSPAHVMSEINMDAVTVGEDGSVTGLTEQLETLRTGSAWLFKPTDPGEGHQHGQAGEGQVVGGANVPASKTGAPTPPRDKDPDREMGRRLAQGAAQNRGDANKTAAHYFGPNAG